MTWDQWLTYIHANWWWILWVLPLAIAWAWVSLSGRISAIRKEVHWMSETMLEERLVAQERKQRLEDAEHVPLSWVYDTDDKRKASELWQKDLRDNAGGA